MSHERVPVEYFEIPSDNNGELKIFYSQLFRESFEGEHEDYWLIKKAGILEDISKRRSTEQSPTLFVTVKSTDDMLEKSKENDAQVLVNKHVIDE